MFSSFFSEVLRNIAAFTLFRSTMIWSFFSIILRFVQVARHSNTNLREKEHVTDEELASHVVGGFIFCARKNVATLINDH